MADLTINISSITQYYATGSAKKTGTGGGISYSSAHDALVAAREMANENTATPTGGTPADGSGSSRSGNDYQFFGSTYGSVSKSYATISSSQSGSTYQANVKCTKTRTSTIYQLKLNFNIPSGLTSDLISEATLKFTGTGSHSGDNYYAIAPASTTEQTSYQKFNNDVILSSEKRSLITSDTTEDYEYSINITEVLKKAVDMGAGWITLARAYNTAPSTDSRITLNSEVVPIIEVKYTYTKCSAPTNIKFTTSDITSQSTSGIVARSGEATIHWSAGSQGINNPINKYIIYYKAGSAPTTSDYTDTVEAISTATSADIALSNLERGTTYYVKIVTKGSIEGFDSDISNDSCNFTINRLPNSPTNVSYTPARVPSSGNLTFSITPGTDPDNQEVSIYYSTTDQQTPTKSNTTKLPSNNVVSGLRNKDNIYFWTFDGLEFSSSSTSASFVTNDSPSVSNVLMTSNDNYDPSTTVSGVTRKYAKVVNGSATVTYDTTHSGSIVSYNWIIEYIDGVTGTNFNSPNRTSQISSNSSFSGVNVVNYGVGFNKAYRLALTVTDDVGDTATDYSNVFGIPAAPTISNIFNKHDGENVSDAIATDFYYQLRFVYNVNNTGISSRYLLYTTDPNFNNGIQTMSINGSDQSDVDLPTNLTHGEKYYFKIRYILDDINDEIYSDTDSSVPYTRAKDITPNSITITPQNSDKVKPYSDSIITLELSLQNMLNWSSNFDVSSNPNDIYSFEFFTSRNNTDYTISNIEVNTEQSSASSGQAIVVININDITTTQWETFFGYGPNNIEENSTNRPLFLIVHTQNSFGEDFPRSVPFSLDFKEGIISNSNPVISIKTTSNSFIDIPIGSGTGNYNDDNRYSLFQGQQIQFTISNVRVYTQQTLKVWLDNLMIEPDTFINPTWSTVSGTGGDRDTYTTNISFTYTIPEIKESSNIDFNIMLRLNNNESKSITHDNLKICKFRRFDISMVRPTITSIEETSTNVFKIHYKIEDCGGDTNVAAGFSAETKQGGFSDIKISFYRSATLSQGYEAFGNEDDAKGLSLNGKDVSKTDSNPITGSPQTLYFGLKVTFTLNFIEISSNIPYGTKIIDSEVYKDLYIFYRESPNLLYGKNFFVLNSKYPSDNRDDQLLEICPSQYVLDNETKYRTKIYFNQNGDTYFELDRSNGDLKINCGSWGSNS